MLTGVTISNENAFWGLSTLPLHPWCQSHTSTSLRTPALDPGLPLCSASARRHHPCEFNNPCDFPATSQSGILGKSVFHEMQLSEWKPYLPRCLRQNPHSLPWLIQQQGLGVLPSNAPQSQPTHPTPINLVTTPQFQDFLPTELLSSTLTPSNLLPTWKGDL